MTATSLNLRPVLYDELKCDILHDSQIKEYNDTGVLVVPNVLTEYQTDLVLKALVGCVNKMLFQNEEFKLKVDDYSTFDVLMNLNLRKEKLNNPEIMYNPDKKFRKTLEIGSAGMCNIFFLPEGLLMRTKKNIYNIYRQLLGSEYLHMSLERFGIKGKGANEMPMHMDINLFEENKFKNRIQGFIVLEIDNEVNDSTPENSGTLGVIKHFHKYLPLAKIFFDSETSPDAQYSLSPTKNTFHLFDTPKYKFLLHKLPKFNEYIKVYTAVSHKKDCSLFDKSIINHAQEVYKKHKIQVPSKCITLKLEAVKCKPGDLVLWDNTIPHRNERTRKIVKPRIVMYLQLNPVSEDGKPLTKTSRYESVAARKEMFKNWTATVYNTSENNTKKHENKLETKLIQEFYTKNAYHSPSKKNITQNKFYGHIKVTNPLTKVLLGFDPCTMEEFTWKDYKAL
ncbi:MAG TPA: hypothetical protein VLE02_01290 [Nitrosarchaeum sp.]|nr:hypothetical protein [Nitrosarchaeum sp.]